MKKFTLGMVLVALFLLGYYVGNIARDYVDDSKDNRVEMSVEDTIKSYKAAKDGVDIDRVEYTRYDKDTEYGDDYISYIGYDEHNNVVAIGGVDLSYATYVLNNI